MESRYGNRLLISCFVSEYSLILSTKTHTQMKEFQRKGRGSVCIEHTLRTDRFRYEEDFSDLASAEKRAVETSMETFKKVFLVKVLAGGYITNTHGVELIGQKIIRSYHRGVLVYEKD